MNTTVSLSPVACGIRPRHLLFTMLLLLCMPSVMLAAQAGAAPETRVSLSQGGPAAVMAQTAGTVATMTAVFAPLVRFGYRGNNALEAAATSTRMQASHVSGGPHYFVDSVRTELLRDADGDGYFHRFRITFDANVDYGTADVYARLYLSLEGGPWNRYYTTDIISLYDTAQDDIYTVVTTLADGYPAGYYDVLIELYDADTDDFLTDTGPLEFAALSILPIEDQTYDEPYDAHHTGSVSVDAGGGGAFGGFESLLLGIVVVCLRRRALANGASLPM